MLDSCVAYSSILNIEEKCSSETSVEFRPSTRCCIPEERTVLIRQVVMKVIIESIAFWHMAPFIFINSYQISKETLQDIA
jgi:hypothetical protein